MVHELKYDEDNQVGMLIFKYHFQFADVDPIFTELEKVLAGKPYRQVVVMMTDNYYIENRETREATADRLSKLKVSEVAFVGGNAASRMVARVLIKTGTIKLNGDFFKSYDEAINWLKSKR